MKTKKILKSSMSVALALTIPSVTASAWPSSHPNIAKADFGDTQATESTKSLLRERINNILNDKDISNRFLGTTYFHKKSNFPYYHVTFEDHPVPDDVIDSTPWYNMWSEATAAKTKLDANSYTENVAKYTIKQLDYYSKLYNFEVSHALSKDGFYTTKAFKTASVIKSDSDGQQDFYEKATGNPKENLKELFEDGLVGIYKQGQDIEINLVANPKKVTKITSFSVNRIATMEPKVNIGPSNEKQTQVAFSIPGELKAEQLVVTNMSYLDENGNPQNTGTFALDIDYSKLEAKPNLDGSNGIPDYTKNLNLKIQKWINRGLQVKEWLLSRETPSIKESDKERINTISTTITELEKLKRNPEASYDQLYKLATPIHEMEDVATLQEVLDQKVAKLLESFEPFSADVYTEESIKEYRNYIESVPKLKNGRDVKELVSLIKEFENAHFKYLKFNTTELQKLIEIAEKRSEKDYTARSWEKFSTALKHAKDWIDQNNKYRPQINNTSDLTSKLYETINNLEKNDGQKGEQVSKISTPKVEKQEESYSISGRLVERGTSSDHRDLYNSPLPNFIKKIDVVPKGNKNELTITFEPSLTSIGNISKAVVGFDYNSSGTVKSPTVLESDNGQINFKPVTYYKKVKLLVDSEQPRISVELVVADELAMRGTDSYTSDLLLDYNNRTDGKTEKNPLKEKIQEKLDYLNNPDVIANFKDIKPIFKTQLEQLKTQANKLLAQENLTEAEVNKFINEFINEENKLEALANLKLALETQKDTYNNFWKENTSFTKESIDLVKNKLEALENRVNNLTVNDVEGVPEEFTNERNEKKTTLVFKTLDEITGELQNLSDYLRINTKKLEAEITKAEQKLKNSQDKPVLVKKQFEGIINEAKRYVEHAKLTPDSTNTDDQVNTDLTDYYKEKLDFATKDFESNTINEVPENPAVENNNNKPSTEGETTPTPNNDEKPTPNSPEIVKPEGTPNTGEVTHSTSTKINAEFKQTNSEATSSANPVLKEAYYVTENGKNYIELILQPLINNQNQPTSVLSKLTIFKDSKEVATDVLEQKETVISFNGKTKTYKYPSKLRISVEDKPTYINVNTYSSSPIFNDGDEHIHTATLKLSYPNTVAANNADKSELNTLFNTTTDKYYDSWNKVFREANNQKDLKIVTNFGTKVNAAQTTLNDKNATKESISTAYNDLLNAKIQYDFLIKLRTSNTQTLANFTSDKNSNNYSKESIDIVDKYLQSKIDRLEELLQTNPKSTEIAGLFRDVETYTTLLRLNTSKLNDDIKTAEEAISKENLDKETKNKVQLAIKEAKEFVNKAKTTRNIEDKRKELSENLDKAIKALKGENTPTEENNKPSENSNTNTNKPTTDNNEGNKPSEKPTPTLPSSEENSVDKTILLIPLESAKILIASDELNPNINKEALAAYKDIVAKVQGAFDDPAASQEDINKATIDLGKALAEYLKTKENTSTNTNPDPTEKPGVNNTAPNNNTDDNKPNNGTNSTPSDNNTNNTPSVDTPTNKPSETSTPGDNITNNTTPSTNAQPNVVKQIFDDNNSGVEVELFGNSPAKKVSVDEVKDENLVKSISEKLNLTENNKVRILDLKLLDDNNEVVNSTAKRTVVIVLKDDEKDVAIYHVKDNGDLELINSSIEGNKVKFEIDHFSKFAIISNSKNDKQAAHQAGHKNKNNLDANSSNSTQNTASENNNTTPNTITGGQKTLSKTGIQSTNLSTLGILALTIGSALFLIRRKNRN